MFEAFFGGNIDRFSPQLKQQEKAIFKELNCFQVLFSLKQQSCHIFVQVQSSNDFFQFAKCGEI